MNTISTPDLCDEHGDNVRVLEVNFRHYGGKQHFWGEIVTIKCFEDNSKVAEVVKTPGNNRVLVVDGGASPRRSLLGATWKSWPTCPLASWRWAAYPAKPKNWATAVAILHWNLAVLHYTQASTYTPT
jgi:hypothetical protein